jgi:hypothetical protein
MTLSMDPSVSSTLYTGHRPLTPQLSLSLGPVGPVAFALEAGEELEEEGGRTRRR